MPRDTDTFTLMLLLLLLLLLVSQTASVETCRTILLTDFGDPDGIYVAEFDYRGRPDFFTQDGVYNLYGESNDNGINFWILDSTRVTFPYYDCQDDADHPMDVQNQWVRRVSPVDDVVDVFPTIECTTEPKTTNTTDIVIYLLTAGAIIFLFVCHLCMYRRRIYANASNCVVCAKRKNEIAKVCSRNL